MRELKGRRRVTLWPAHPSSGAQAEQRRACAQAAAAKNSNGVAAAQQDKGQLTAPEAAVTVCSAARRPYRRRPCQRASLQCGQCGGSRACQ